MPNGDSERAIALLDELTARRGTDEEIRLAADTLRRRIVSSVASDVSAGRPPLVGRDEIVKRLWSALTRAVGGRGGGVVLWGPAGIGKTRLLHELDAVRLTGAARLVRFEARPAHGLRPFAMILELAGCLLEEPGAAGCDPRAYALLVRARDADVPNDPARGATAASRKHSAMRSPSSLAAVSDESPTILTIDDVHAVDGAIWRVLRNLVRGAPTDVSSGSSPTEPSTRRSSRSSPSRASCSAFGCNASTPPPRPPHQGARAVTGDRSRAAVRRRRRPPASCCRL